MSSLKEKLLANIKGKDVCELITDHVEDVSLNENVATLLIDKRYAINILQTSKYIESLINGVKKTFGENVSTTLRLAHSHHGHEREMLVPHAVHYG
ncbi:hypothetical protein M0P65_05615 [Candidatus Gracilibacteria bacterium]|nr:hypothetical protein [Candidatus Gracilibacteria bacterium]